mgnify:CR=1 FL=1
MSDIILEIYNSEEPFFSNYKKKLKGLNEVINSHNTHFEGCLFYKCIDGGIKEDLEPRFLLKRKVFSIFAKNADVMVEIGVNGGHSTLLALESNLNLKYYGIDVCCHSYATAAMLFLKEHYADRTTFIKGDSQKVLPKLFDLHPELKDKQIAWVIDGGHQIEIASSDLKNIIKLGKPGEFILFDDYASNSSFELMFFNEVLNGTISIEKEFKVQAVLKIK